ncbi:MAG: DUF5709 domain-containing protein [Pseudonocardiaceae bacterium]
MAENEYEEQPHVPDLGASVQLETSESTVGPPGEDALDPSYVPPDRPIALDEAPTSAELREPETLDARLARERPDIGDEPDQDLGVGPRRDGIAGDERSGRLAPAEPTAIEATGPEPLESTDAVDLGIDGGAASAEEAAVHDLANGPPVTGDDVTDRDEHPLGPTS